MNNSATTHTGAGTSCAGPLALLIAPTGFWKLYGLRLRRVHTEGEEYAGGDYIDDAQGIDDPDLRHLVEHCRATQTDELYRKTGKNYNNKKLFFEKAPKITRQYATSIVEQHMVKAVELAARLGVHIFFAPKPGEWLKQSQELVFSPEPLSLHAAFAKTDSGLDYRLTLADGIVPSEHHVEILCNNPSLFTIDHRLHTLKAGLGGKLLTPFLKNEVYHIPANMQSAYFRQFILKIVSKIDISADGFDVENQHPEGRALLELIPDITGHYTLHLSFKYGTTVFRSEERREKSATLIDNGDNVCFACVWRDNTWESSIVQLLDDRLRRPQSAPLRNAIAWLTAHEATLAQHRVDIVQHTTRHYTIGDVRQLHDDHWAGDWFSLHVTLHFPDGTVMPLLHLRDAIVNGDDEVRLPSGNWFVIPEEWFARYSAVMLFGIKKGNDTLTFHRSQSAILPDTATTNAMAGASAHTFDTSMPQGLKATLRPYQLQGFQWMIDRMNQGMGCLLGDDMGLGKTVQAIAVIMKYCEATTTRQRSDDGQPGTTTADNMQALTKRRKAAVVRQLSLFAEDGADARPHTAGSTANSLEATPENQTAGTDGPTVQKPLRQPVLVAAPSSVVFNWRDELQRFAPLLKVLVYTGTLGERAAKQPLLPFADVVLTSYPVLRNDIGTLATLHFSIAVYDEAHAFRNNTSQLYQAVTRVPAQHSIALTGTPMANALGELWSLMSVLNPSLLGDYDTFQRNFIHPINANLTGSRTAILRRLVAPFFLRRLRGDVLDSLPERQDETVWCDMTQEQNALYQEEQSRMRNLLLDPQQASNRIMVLAAITRLRQLACCPAMMGKDAGSGKMDEVMNRLEQLRGSGHKVLLFSEFTRFLDIVARNMDQQGWSYDMLTGQTKDREGVVKHFQQTPSCQFFLVSLKAGGEGLNLTQADYVFLLDPWWNHAAEEQAIARAHRSGQRHAVMVYRFITTGSLEEQILKLQDSKEDLVDAILRPMKLQET